jgi:hypothetical protein
VIVSDVCDFFVAVFDKVAVVVVKIVGVDFRNSCGIFFLIKCWSSIMRC